LKIGIYEGSIPPPVFINNLLQGLANNGNNVFLYGRKKNKLFSYNTKKIIQRLTKREKIGSIFYLFYNIFYLFFSQNFHSSSFLLKEIVKRSNGYKSFVIRCNRVLPVFLDDLDVFHIQWAKDLVAYPEFIKYLKCPIILSFRGAHINYSPLLDKELSKQYRRYFPQVNMFHAVSKTISKEGQKYCAEPKNIKVIYPAVKSEIIKDDFLPQDFNNTNTIKIISIGRCHWKKGYMYALDTMKLLKNKNIDFHYTIVAMGKNYDMILYQIKDLGLENYVTFINGLDHKSTINILKKSDLYLLPSVEEGISNTVLESMAVGTMVLTTNCGGMSEVIENNKNGMIVNSREPKEMFTKILLFSKMNLNDKNKILINAKQTIEENFLMPNQISQMNKLYEVAIERKNTN